MLVLTRRLGETIIVDGKIAITVVGFKGERVRLGVLAPKEVTVDRQEIHERRLEFGSGGPVTLREGPVLR
jgi:carbon storage regulator